MKQEKKGKKFEGAFKAWKMGVGSGGDAEHYIFCV